MSLITVNPTNFVNAGTTSPSNTGHAQTTLSVGPDDGLLASCQWNTFITPGGRVSSINLKMTWNRHGASLTGTNRSNSFRLRYSLNGGSAWTVIVQQNDVTGASNNNNVDISISSSQDISQIRVDDSFDASTGETSSASISISIVNIRLEIETNLGSGASGGFF